MPTKINILSQVKGMSNKTPCVVATTGNTSFSAISIIDGITLSNNDRVLVWKQSNATQNGIYIFSGGTLTRALDSNAPDDFIQGMQILVISGNTYDETLFYQTSVVSTIGSSNINFGIFGGLNGTSGTTGTTGSSGQSGTSGTSGTSGSSGTSGTSGTSGSSGTSGTSGSSGTSGTSGTSPASQISGSGTSGYLAKFTGTTNLGNSIIYDDGTNVGIGNTATGGFKLDVSGTGRFTGGLTGTSAIFSSNVTSQGASENLFIANGNTYSGVRLQRNGTAKWAIFNNNASTDFFDIYNYTTASSAFKINPTTNETTLAGSLSLTGSTSGIPGLKVSLASASGFHLMINNNTFGTTDIKGLGFIQNNDGVSSIYNNNINAMSISTIGNVGIGTTSPGVKLFVQGSVAGNYSTTAGQIVSTFFNSPASIGSGVNSSFIRLQTTSNAGSDNPIAEIGVVGEAYNSNLASFVITTRNNSGISERMRVNSDGNVGIGTASPGNLLTIKDKSQIGFRDETSNSTREALSNYAYTPTYGDGLKIGTGYNAVSISGKVGIGTTNPISTFTINSDAAGGVGGIVTNNVYPMRLINSPTAGSGSYNVFDLRMARGGVSNRNPSFSFSTDNTDGDFYNICQIGSIADLASGNTIAGNLIFSTKPSGSNVTERMRITSTGNVGIGTTSPLAPFHVQSTLTKTATNYWHYLMFDNTAPAVGVGAGFMFGGLKTASAQEVFAAIDGYKETSSVTPGSNAAGAMRFHTQPSDGSGVVERMRITSTGNVGIGTASPVSGQGTPLTLESSNGFVGITFNGTGAYTNIWQLYASGNGAGTNFFGIFDRTNNTYRLVASSAGNVGIGTANPDSKLHIISDVAAGTNNYALRLQNTTTASDARVGIAFLDNSQIASNGSGATIQVSNNGVDGGGNLLFGSLLNGTNTERMRIRSDGNVGINYAGDASTRLAVFGVGTTSGTFGFLVANSGTTTSMWVKDNGDGYLRASAWAYGSDRRMKENISDVENGLDMVLKMKPKHFDYINGQKDNLGFIAQDVQEIIPQAVSISDEKTGMLALKTDFLVPYLVKSVQELSAQINILKQEIINLKNK